MVVGIGASAGGLQALQELFDELPSATGISFVVVQHLSPDFKSMMVQLLARRASMTVQDAEDGVHPEPNTVYLLPPKKDIELREGRLRLHQREVGTRLHMPIDMFFHSLAMDRKDQCAAVVLSGTGSDGSRGLVAIRQAGGMVLVQSTESAKFDGMPVAAQSTGLVDFVGTPGEIASMLIRRASPERRGEVPGSLTVLQELFADFRRATGIDLAKYKDTTVTRRLQRRMQITGQDTLEDYRSYIEATPSEMRQLRLEMLIGVSSFFRDEETWRYLADEVFESLLQDHPERPLRAWVSACSTGEEAYTTAILLSEAFRDSGEPADFKLFATDVSEEAIRQASEGLYSEKALASVPEPLVERYFEATDTGYRVRRTLRERITFAVHNLLVDPPFTRLAFVSCRNMLIYLKPENQQHVLSRIQFGLVPQGLLFLGASETVGDLAPQLTVRSARHKVFESIGPSLPGGTFADTRTPVVRPRGRHRGPMEDLYYSVLNKFVPAGLAVDERFEILHVFGNVQPYIQFPQGQMSTNLLRMLPPAASILVSSAARRSRESDEPVVVTSVALPGDKSGDIKVHSYQRSQDETGYMVFFEEHAAPSRSGALPLELNQASADRMATLEAELTITREHLRTAVQDLEASNEELQATNEELVASNEELQSTNEELQSVNEELYTVNAEYQAKIGQLEELSQDLGDLLKTIKVGAIFVDNQLTIRRYNDIATQVVPLIAHDRGRHLRDLRWRIDYPELETDAQTVLSTGEALTRHARDGDGTLWEISIRRHAHEGTPPGLLMIVADVTLYREREEQLVNEAALYDAASQLARIGVALLDLEQRTVEMSPASRDVLGVGKGVAIEFESFEAMLQRPAEAYEGFDAVRTFETTTKQIPLRVVARPGAQGTTLVVAFQPAGAARTG